MGRKKLWYNPKTHSGWRKKQNPSTRRSKLLASTDKRKSMHARYVAAARKAQSLSNVTKDRTTKSLARRDAMYYFRKARQTK